MLIYSRTNVREERGETDKRTGKISRPGEDSLKKKKIKKENTLRLGRRHVILRAPRCRCLQVCVSSSSPPLSSPPPPLPSRIFPNMTRRQDSRTSRSPESLKEVI